MAYYASARRLCPGTRRRTRDFDDAASALHSEQTLCSNPAVSNIHAAMYSLFSIFCRLPGGTPLSPMQPSYDRFPYGLASSADAYARGLRRMPAPPPLASEFVGMASYAPTYFLDLMDDNGESDGSSIGDMAPSHRPSQECTAADHLGHPPAEAKSSQTHTSLDPHVETPKLTLKHGEELRQRWLHQPPTALARSAHHAAPRAHRPANGARGHVHHP